MKIQVVIGRDEIHSLLNFCDTVDRRGSDEYPDVAHIAVEALLKSVGDSRWYSDGKLRMVSYSDTTATDDSLLDSLSRAIGNGVNVEISADPMLTAVITKLE